MGCAFEEKKRDFSVNTEIFIFILTEIYREKKTRFLPKKSAFYTGVERNGEIRNFT